MDRTTIAELLLSVGALELRTNEPFFTFASGIRSPVYTDNRLLISDPGARRTVCNAFAERLVALDLEPAVIAGTATAGIPHAAFLAEKLGLPMVYVRGASKAHGRGKQIEGQLLAGTRVLLVEDLISTGGSAIAAAKALRDAGAEVVGVVAIFSYGFASARQAFAEAELRLEPLVTFADVVAVAQQDGRISDSAATLLARWSANPEQWPEPTAAAETLPAAAEACERLVVAADLAERSAVEQLARSVSGIAGYLKLNSAFVAHGPSLVATVRKLGLRIFLDLKFHDIPNTAANYIRAVAQMGVDLVTVHATGGPAMIEACAEAAQTSPGTAPRVLTVTALTSLDDNALSTVGVASGREDQVLRLARLAQQHGADGIVCSVAEAPAVRAACGDRFLIVTPGVRPADDTADDHARSATPSAARRAGADYIVVGRPIYRAKDPAISARAIAAELRDR